MFIKSILKRNKLIKAIEPQLSQMEHCKKINHENSPISLLCIEANCQFNEAVCPFCLYESHSGHLVVPISIYVNKFKESYKDEHERNGLKNKIEEFNQLKKSFEEKISSLRASFNLILTLFQQSLTQILEKDLFSFPLHQAKLLLDLFPSCSLSSPPSSYPPSSSPPPTCPPPLSSLSPSISIIPPPSLLPNSLLLLQPLSSLSSSTSSSPSSSPSRKLSQKSDFSFIPFSSLSSSLSLLLRRLFLLSSSLSSSSSSLLSSLSTSLLSFLNKIKQNSPRLMLEGPLTSSKLEGHRNCIRRVVGLDECGGVASCSEDGQIRVWNGLTGGLTSSEIAKSSIKKLHQKNPCVAVLSGHKGQVYDLIYLKNKHLLASASQDHKIKIWSLHSFLCIRTLIGHEGWVGHLAYDPSSSLLFSGGADRKVRVWNIDEGVCLKVFPSTESEIFSLECLKIENEPKIIVGDIRGRIYLFSIDGKLEKKINAHNDKILKLKGFERKKGSKWQPEWDLTEASVDREMEEKIDMSNEGKDSVQDLEVTLKMLANSAEKKERTVTNLCSKIRIENNEKVSNGSRDNDNLETSHLWEKSKGDCKGGDCLLISCSNDRTIKIWDAVSMEIVKILEVHTSFVTDFWVDEENEMLLSCSFDNTIKMIDLRDYGILGSWKEENNLINIIWMKNANVLCTTNRTPNDFALHLNYY